MRCCYRVLFCFFFSFFFRLCVCVCVAREWLPSTETMESISGRFSFVFRLLRRRRRRRRRLLLQDGPDGPFFLGNLG